MHKYVIFNGELLLAEEAKIPALSSAAIFGQTVFTTLAIYNGRPFLWNEHWARLNEHAKKVGVQSVRENEVLSSLASLIKTNFVENGKARITFFSGEEKGMWQTGFSSVPHTHFLIMTADVSDMLNNKAVITTSSKVINSQLPLTAIKSISYLDNVQALEEAREKEFDEAIRINEKGEIVSACMANIFWVKERELFTPDLKTGAMEGTTRGLIIKLANELSIPLRFSQSDVVELENAKEIFLTSSGVGVCIVRRFNERTLIYKPDSFAFQLRETFRDITASV
jgi:branched-subunit amino acid aminotransferase/4-amino-4-deoxychorismate lyase